MPELENLLGIMYSNLLDNPGEPYCAACWYGEADVTAPLVLNEEGDLECPNCYMVIEVKGVE